jgi:hypothetical protein
MLLGSTKPQAVEILRDFRRRALASKRYSPYILDKPEELDEYGDKAVLGRKEQDGGAIHQEPGRPTETKQDNRIRDRQPRRAGVMA